MKYGKSGGVKTATVKLCYGAAVAPIVEILLLSLEGGEKRGAPRLLVVFINFLSRTATCHQVAPRHQCCLAVFSLPTRSQNVKLVELTRSDREILHVWPGCLSKFGVLLVVWGTCWKPLEFWTKPSIQRLLVSCWGNPSIKQEEIWARRMWLLQAQPTEVSTTSPQMTSNVTSTWSSWISGFFWK